MAGKTPGTKIEKPTVKTLPTELEDEQLNQMQGGRSVKQPAKAEPLERDGRAMGDNLVSIEANPS